LLANRTREIVHALLRSRIRGESPIRRNGYGDRRFRVEDDRFLTHRGVASRQGPRSSAFGRGNGAVPVINKDDALNQRSAGQI
jgi:hypothetical protein